jgi:hypothetical protein
MPAWRGWYHVSGNTYGTWLPGDPRGWREKKHRTHVDGDYRSPPPPGIGDGLRHHADRLLRQPPMHLAPPLRALAGQALVEMLGRQDVEVLSVSVSAVHFHILARFSDGSVRPRVGRAKKHAWHRLRASGHRGRLWQRSCGVKPIADRAHQVRTYRYILAHEDEGAWVWHFREGLYWL